MAVDRDHGRMRRRHDPRIALAAGIRTPQAAEAKGHRFNGPGVNVLRVMRTSDCEFTDDSPQAARMGFQRKSCAAGEGC